MISRTNAVLAGLLVGILAIASMVRVDHSKPNIEVLPDMKYTPAWPAFAKNPNFANGRTMQAPVPGTIARGDLPLYYLATKEDAVRAGEELRNPFAKDDLLEAAASAGTPEGAAAGATAADTSDDAAKASDDAERLAVAQKLRAASIARGGDTYRVFCRSCHGAGGLGDGAVTQRGFPPPPSLLTGKSREMKDGQLFHILTYGQGTMAPLAAQLSRGQRWDAINYVRDLQSRGATSAASPPAPESANDTAADPANDTAPAPSNDTTPKDAP